MKALTDSPPVLLISSLPDRPLFNGGVPVWLYLKFGEIP
jgi:hypothetical protein